MKTKMIHKFLILLICFIPGFVSGQNHLYKDTDVKIGVSQINITPGKPMLMSGYAQRTDKFTSVHDELYASAICFSDEETKILLITADLIGFSFELTDEIKSLISASTGIPHENIILAATHTHGGPALRTYSREEVSEEVNDYVTILKDKLLSLSIEASKKLVPFTMGMGKNNCKMNINRRAVFADGGIWLGRNPEGPCDHDLDIVEFKDLENNTLAFLINWPCHGTVRAADNLQISGDWPGAAARYIKKQAGENVIVAVTIGASGDIAPLYARARDFKEVEAIGFHVAKKTLETIPELVTLPVKSMQVENYVMAFPEKNQHKDHFPQISYESGSEIEIRLTVVKIGSLVLTGISGEVMTEIGMEIKKRSPNSHTMILTHCNGSSGYICTDKSYPEGGYEVKVSQLMPGVEKPLIDKVVEMVYFKKR